MTLSQENYSMHNKEMYRIIIFCKNFRPYIQGQKTIVATQLALLQQFFKQ